MKIFAIIVILGAFAMLVISVINIVDGDKRWYTGTIKYKIGNTAQAKYHTYTDRVFVVEFPATDKESAFIMEIRPDWNTFLSKEQGDKVSYYIVHPDRDSISICIIMIIISIFGISLGILCLPENE